MAKGRRFAPSGRGRRLVSASASAPLYAFGGNGFVAWTGPLRGEAGPDVGPLDWPDDAVLVDLATVSTYNGDVDIARPFVKVFEPPEPWPDDGGEASGSEPAAEPGVQDRSRPFGALFEPVVAWPGEYSFTGTAAIQDASRPSAVGDRSDDSWQPQPRDADSIEPQWLAVDPDDLSDGSDPHGAPAATMPRLRAAEAEMATVERHESRLLVAGRARFGMSGRRERIPFRVALAASCLDGPALAKLYGLAATPMAATTALVAAGPDAKLTLGAGAVVVPTALRLLLVGLGAVAGVAAGRSGARPRVARAAVGVAAVALLAGGLAGRSLVVLAASVAVAVVEGVVAAAVLPMVLDGMRPEARVRSAGGWVAALAAGASTGRLAVVLASGAGFTWRAALLSVATVAAVVSLSARALPPIPVGALDRDRLRRLVRRRLADRSTGAGPLDAGDDRAGLAEGFRRALAAPSSRALLGAAAIAGAYSGALPALLDPYLRDRWGMVATSRDLLIAAVPVPAAVLTLWWAARSEPALGVGPRRFVLRAAELAALASVALAVAAVAPGFTVTVVFLIVALGAAGVVLVAAAVLLLTQCDPRFRGEAAGALAVAVIVGGIGGQLLAVTIGDRFGVVWALVTIAFLALGAASRLSMAAPMVERDIDAVITRVVEQQELASRVRLGHHLPLLSCRHVDFSYGPLQVLFDVSFTVDDGEMVALLGTNGAGKSTLLRVISGLGLPSAGSLHYQGSDITFLAADRRVTRGISQIPGGRAVFGNLPVTDNLRAYGYTHGRQRGKIDSAMDEVFDAFPRLGERRNQLASTLSGGEQQMLALAKAFVLKPQLLLIDELSLGLAPKVVGELLEMVRRINASGTAVVLVEQSVNIALSVVDHAYFMEKGEVRFDGVAKELLERPDLLRSVFLQGATQGMATAGPA